LEAFVQGCADNGVCRDAAVLPTVILTKSAGALRFMESSVPGIHVPADVIDRIASASDPLEESIGVVHRPGSLGPKPCDGSITASPVRPMTGGECAQR